MELNKKQFKKIFPHLNEEINNGKNNLSINSVNSYLEQRQRNVRKKFNGYKPSIIDFLRRCETNLQAEEIISYLENKNEISYEDANKLRKQLKKKGLRSFGSKKETDYYLKQARC